MEAASQFYAAGPRYTRPQSEASGAGVNGRGIEGDSRYGLLAAAIQGGSGFIGLPENFFDAE